MTINLENCDEIVKEEIVISLCDYTGTFVESWAKAGYKCFIFDCQHKGSIEGNIHKIPGRIEENIGFLMYLFNVYKVKFAAAFPPCTDLAVSGAAHFASKRDRDPLFQSKAMSFFVMCYNILKDSGAPFIIENPVSVASSYFRKPDYSFHPWEYGGYLPEDDINPVSELIPARDAYPKKTCLWTGNGFKMPETKPIEKPEGYSPMHHKLGGKSLKTKNIRSATPRGFAAAVFEMYSRTNPLGE